MSSPLCICTALLLFGSGFGCGDDDEEVQQTLAEVYANTGTTCTPSDTKVCFGVIYPEDVSASQIPAIRTAVAEMNHSGVFDREIGLSVRQHTDSSDRTAIAEELLNSGVIAMASEFSSTAKRVLQFTNETFTNVVQTSGSSTNTTINDPETPAETDWAFSSDKNDTLFRLVANDRKQARISWSLVGDKAKAGLLYIDEEYGESFKNEIERFAADESITLAVVDPFPAENLQVSDLSAIIPNVLAKNAAGELDFLIVIALQDDGNLIVSELTKGNSPFAGTIIMADGVVEKDFFNSLPADFADWMATAGNNLLATAPLMYPTANGDPIEYASHTRWLDQFTELAGTVDTSQPFIPAHADCIYIMGMAMAMGSGDARFEAATIKANMKKFQQAEFAGVDAADIEDISVDEFGTIADMISAGKKVRYTGASGRVVFDSDGDRVNQRYKVVTPDNTSGAFAWTDSQVCDADSLTCIPF